MKKALAAFFLSLLFQGVGDCAHMPERVYQEKWCAEQGGVTEYRLEDGARVDCLTDEFAVEADFARKWAESIGQALFYSSVTDKRPGILLIMERETDGRYLKRLRTVADRLGIKVWVLREE